MLYTTNKDGDKTSHNFIGIEGNTISTIRYNLSGLEYYVYNKDIRGSISNIVDNNGNAKLSYTYSDFGETEEIGDTTFYNEIAYTGGIYDEDTSLYYLNARYYNPEDARFITQDTYRGESNNPSSLHLYAYCANNPINYVDPSGHLLCAISHVVSGTVIINMSATRSVVISSSGRIGVAKGASIGISIGSGILGASTGFQISLYGNTSKIGDLGGHAFDAAISANVYGFNASAGTSISVKNKSSKGKVLPVISGGISTNRLFEINANVDISYSRVKAFPYSIDTYKRHPGKTYKYNYLGEKQSIKCKATYIEIKYFVFKIKISNTKSYQIRN